MHPAASLIAEHVRKNQHLLAPALLVVLAAVANIHSPVQHSLLVSCVSWALVWIPAIFRAGLWSSSGSRSRKTTSWLAGGFLALSAVCERAACDKEGIWALKGFLPLLVVLLSEHGFLSKHVALPSYAPADDSTADAPNSEKRSHTRSFRVLAIATISAATVLASRYSLSTTSALGISSVIFAATGLVLFESALKVTKDGSDTGSRGFMSANGTFSRRSSFGAGQKDQQLASLRDVAAVVTLICGLATYLFEPTITPDAISWEPVYRELRGDWKTLHYHRTVQQVLLMVGVNVVVNILIFVMLFQQGAVYTSFLTLFACMCAKLRLATSFPGVWFTILYGSSALFFVSGASSSSFVDIRSSIRFKRLIFGVSALSIGLWLFRYASHAHHHRGSPHDPSSFDVILPDTPLMPLPMDLKKGHPAAQLIDNAEKEFEDLLNRQSKSLDEAVKEYRRRNGIAPPPHFDKWYEFATRNKVVLIDEFDTITQSLLPYWAVKPSTVRSRIKNALGHDESALVGMTIRDGNVVKVEGGQEWQQQATAGMMKDFVQYLPDMDLGFNIHDEPRVVVPNNQLSAMIAKARDEILPGIANLDTPRNAFSARPSDMNDGKRFEESKTTRFNRFAHQQTWTHARLSCPAESQAQNFEDHAADNLTAYATGPLKYIYNQTAFSDICNSPSLSSSFGFFERPNAFNIIHELTPIFSQSKISSFQDIIYPSPWYWFGRVGYDEDRDTTWENKTNSLYWRGSTTGGFSRNGGWRRQHRQHVVKRFNALDKTDILARTSDGENPSYEVQQVDRKDLKRFVDVKFSHIGQCDPGDCDAQKEFFELVERADGQDAWYFKHLLDMDGNAFSGRFYSFLKSRSLTYKMAIFREWHQEWLRPWIHYVPLTLIGDEHLDLVQWFGGGAQKNDDVTPTEEEKNNKGGNGDSLGERKAREIAMRSTEWHDRVLRQVDFEAWFFRLLLEYGRIIDDNRHEIGYPGP